jgi:site-specific recombinase XerD
MDHAATASARLASVLARLAGAYAANTLRSYRSDFEQFIAWCAARDACPLPATPETLADYVAAVTERLKPATIRRRISGIGLIHRFARYPDPTRDEEVYLALRRMHRRRGRRQRQVIGLTAAIRDQLIAASGADTQGLRDELLVRLGYDSMRRRSELVALLVQDLTRHRDGTARVLLRFSKTDQEGEGRLLTLSAETCAVMDQWLQRAGLTEGPILRSVSRYGVVGPRLSPESVSRIIKRLAARAGLPAAVTARLSGHSARVGAAQDMLIEGKTLIQIMQRGGWRKPETVFRYIEHAEQAEPF